MPPDWPARPQYLTLLAPADMPRRRFATLSGRIALLHAIAHIELNAIDLAFDMALRFAPEIDSVGLDSRNFVHEWFLVGADEARHFLMLEHRLGEMGARYGDLPAHGALWEAAALTSDSVLARLAVAPLVLEARGLDVTPGMASRLRQTGDEASASVLDTIFEEEIGHVATGARWFLQLCNALALAAEVTFKDLVASRFRGSLTPPFNHQARSSAGLPAAFYSNWNNPCDHGEAANLLNR